MRCVRFLALGSILVKSENTESGVLRQGIQSVQSKKRSQSCIGETETRGLIQKRGRTVIDGGRLGILTVVGSVRSYIIEKDC